MCTRRHRAAGQARDERRRPRRATGARGRGSCTALRRPPHPELSQRALHVPSVEGTPSNEPAGDAEGIEVRDRQAERRARARPAPVAVHPGDSTLSVAQADRRRGRVRSMGRRKGAVCCCSSDLAVPEAADQAVIALEAIPAVAHVMRQATADGRLEMSSADLPAAGVDRALEALSAVGLSPEHIMVERTNAIGPIERRGRWLTFGLEPLVWAEVVEAGSGERQTPSSVPHLYGRGGGPGRVRRHLRERHVDGRRHGREPRPPTRDGSLRRHRGTPTPAVLPRARDAHDRTRGCPPVRCNPCLPPRCQWVPGGPPSGWERARDRPIHEALASRHHHRIRRRGCGDARCRNQGECGHRCRDLGSHHPVRGLLRCRLGHRFDRTRRRRGLGS